MTQQVPITLLCSQPVAAADAAPLAALTAAHATRWVSLHVALDGHVRVDIRAGGTPPRFLVAPGSAPDEAMVAALRRAIAKSEPGVILALDRPTIRAAYALRGELPHHLIVELPAIAHRVATLMEGGRSATSLRYPPPPGARPASAPWLRTGEATRPDADWLELGTSSLTVRDSELNSVVRAAIRERAGFAPGQCEARGRLLIAPANYAGQGWAWSQAVRRHAPDWEARNVAVYSARANLSFPADRQLTVQEWADPVARVDLAATEVLPATHVLVEAMRPVVGVGISGVDGWSPVAAVRDAEALMRSGRKVALLFHGTEVRDPVSHARTSVWSPFDPSGNADATKRLRCVVKSVGEARETLGLPAFVSTPDLLDYVPDATWLPVTLLPGDFTPAPPAMERDVPVVLHAPSASHLKGSQFVDEVLEDLAARGLVVYRRLRGLSPLLIPHALRQADIVIDQIVLGNPGVLAAQAMAAGRVVVGHLSPAVRRAFGTDPPVCEATPLSLRSTLLDLLSDREYARTLAARGTAFAHTFHDGRLAAQTLRRAFLEPGTHDSPEVLVNVAR